MIRTQFYFGVPLFAPRLKLLSTNLIEYRCKSSTRGAGKDENLKKRKGDFQNIIKFSMILGENHKDPKICFQYQNKYN